MKVTIVPTPPAVQTAPPVGQTELPDRWVKPDVQAMLQDGGLLLLRLGAGALILTHGVPKLMTYAEKSASFFDPLGIGGPASMALAIFAEVICAGLVMAGLTTRLASLALVINFAVIIQIVQASAPFARKELAVFYLLAYGVLLLMGPGRLALDRLIKRAIDKRTVAKVKADPAPSPQILTQV